MALNVTLSLLLFHQKNFFFRYPEKNESVKYLPLFEYYSSWHKESAILCQNNFNKKKRVFWAVARKSYWRRPRAISIGKQYRRRDPPHVCHISRPLALIFTVFPALIYHEAATTTCNRMRFYTSVSQNGNKKCHVTHLMLLSFWLLNH